MDARDYLESLISQEIFEACSQYEKLLHFLEKPPGKLSTSKIEGSYLTYSQQRDSDFKSYNVGRIQNISVDGLEEVFKQMRSCPQPHSLITVPLGLKEEIYLRLSKSYRVYEQRSILYLLMGNMVPNELPNNFITINAGNSDQFLSESYEVIRSRAPVEKDYFEKNYSCWVRDNHKIKVFIAKIDGKPVGTGTLSSNGETGILSYGIINPEFQGYGIQKHLIQQRLLMAKEMNLKIIFTPFVPPFSASEYNLQKASFSMMCTKSLWHPYES